MGLDNVVQGIAVHPKDQRVDGRLITHRAKFNPSELFVERVVFRSLSLLHCCTVSSHHLDCLFLKRITPVIATSPTVVFGIHIVNAVSTAYEAPEGWTRVSRWREIGTGWLIPLFPAS